MTNRIEPVKKSFGWKTITGAFLWAIGYVSQPDTLALLPPKWATIISAIGAVLAAFGLRAAQAKTQQTAEVGAREAEGARIIGASRVSAATRESPGSRSPMGGS